MTFEQKSTWKTHWRGLKTQSAFAIVVLTVVLFGYAGGLDPILRFLVEGRFSAESKAPSGEIVIVEIDAKSLSDVGVWPWPRGLHGELVDKVIEQGAAEVYFDVDFSTQSTPEEDAKFAEALARAEGAVTLATFRQQSNFGTTGDGGGHVNRPLDLFLEHSWPGVVSVPVSTDGQIWHALYGDQVGQGVEPSLSALMSGVPTKTEGAFWIDYSIDPLKFERVSFVDVLNGTAPSHVFQDKVVIVCATAQELRDIFSVPVYGLLPGGVIQALGAESIIQGRALETTGRWTIFGLTIVLLLPVVLLVKINWQVRVLALVVLAVAIEVAAYSVQQVRPIIPDTSATHFLFGMTALYVLFRQIGFHKILALVSQRRAENTEQMLKQVFDDSFDAIIVIDQDLTLRMASHKADTVFQRDFEAGQSAHDVLPSAVIEDVNSAFDGATETYSASKKNIELDVGNGNRRHVEYVVTTTTQQTAQKSDNGKESLSRLASVTCRDVTFEREAQKRLAYLARHDPLTGLLNRNAFEMECDVRLQTADPDEVFCVYCIAVDEIDSVKASLGMAYSDDLLRSVGEDLQACIGEDAYLGVLHDNSYAVFVPITPETGCSEGWAERLQAGISEDFSSNGNRVPVSISMGYVSSKKAGTDTSAGQLIRKAGNALSRAKLDMRASTIQFEPHMEEGLVRRRALEIELTNALERDELSVFYQPQVEFSDKRLLGVEALIRWNHQTIGPISPAEFIPIAEESGMILEIGEWVMNRAASDLVKLGGDILLSVNVSPQQFMQQSFADVVKNCLDQTGFPSERMKLEITESMFVGQTDELQMRIDAIRDLGCQFALDDFGTGYSGLSQLAWFPFSWIKIDRAFVDDMETSKSHYALVKTIVDLARAFDLKVVAEGIENEEQHVLLRELGCDLGQGYYYGKPMDLETFCKTYGLEAEAAPVITQEQPLKLEVGAQS